LRAELLAAREEAYNSLARMKALKNPSAEL
jgi:hypothetical protein